MHIQSNGPSHRDNQGVPLLDQQITFGKHKGRTLGDLLENERGYLEWLAKSDNQKWSPIAQQVLEESSKAPADPETGEVLEAGDIPPAVLKMAEKAGMVTEDFLMFIDEKYGKPWSALSGDEKSEVTRHLHELGQAGA